MTIARKLWIGFGIVVLIFLAASLIILVSQRFINSAIDEIANVEAPTRDASQEMEINLIEMGRDVSEYLRKSDLRYREQFTEDRAEFEESKTRYDELVDTPTGREQGERIGLLYGEYIALGESLMDQYEEQAGTSDDSVEEEQELLELQENLDDVLDGEVQPWTGQQLVEAEEDANDAIRNVYVTTTVLLLLGLLFSTLAAYFISRGILRSVARLAEGARKIGEGDLEHRMELDTADELGTVAAAFDEMAERRRRSDVELREAQERFRSLSDATFEGIAVVYEGSISETNQAYRVNVASNDREALDALDRTPYAAVLMDVQMPEMDGYEATQEIRRRESEAVWKSDASPRHLPIIATTANALEGDREKAIAAGMDDYAAKPVQPAQLGEILERWTADAKGAELPPEGAGAINEADAKGQTGPEEPLDPDVLAGLRELGNANLLAELVELFVDDAQSRNPALQDAFEKNDAEAVERIAHTLKGSCGNMSALRMAEICENLQEVGHSGDLSRASVLIEQLQAGFGRVRQALEAELSKERP